MSISDNIAGFKCRPLCRMHKILTTKKISRAAIWAFKGDVYTGLDADLTDEDVQFAQRHLRMLSGLYGLLSPLI